MSGINRHIDELNQRYGSVLINLHDHPTPIVAPVSHDDLKRDMFPAQHLVEPGGRIPLCVAKLKSILAELEAHSKIHSELEGTAARLRLVVDDLGGVA